MTIKEKKNRILLFLKESNFTNNITCPRLYFQEQTGISLNDDAVKLLKQDGLTFNTKDDIKLTPQGNLYCEENNLMALVNPLKGDDRNNNLSFDEKLDLLFKYMYDNRHDPALPLDDIARRCGFTPNRVELNELDAEVETSNMVENHKQYHHYNNWYKLSAAGYKALKLVGGLYSKWKEELNKAMEEEKRETNKSNVGSYTFNGPIHGPVNAGNIAGNQEYTNEPASPIVEKETDKMHPFKKSFFDESGKRTAAIVFVLILAAILIFLKLCTPL